MYCHFQSMTHSNIEDKKAMSTVICQNNQSHYFDHFPICQEANGVSEESTYADNTKLSTAEICTSSYQTHVTEVVKDMCDN